MERQKWKEHKNNGYKDEFLCDVDRERSPMIPSSVSSSPSRPLGYIEHHVSKFDTLAGIAIKYGVEVLDVKRMNGLVTDHQMFALKTLQIPLPGRHPPSPCLSNGSSITGLGNSGHNSPDYAHRELLESFQSLTTKSSERKVSPAMSSLRGYYGLKGTSKSSAPMSSRPLSCPRKSKSLVNVILEEIMEKSDTEPSAGARESESDKWNGKLVRRRQKSEADFTRIPELLMRPDNSSSGGLPSRKGKGLALRQNAASRTAAVTDSESNCLSLVTIGLGDASLTDGSSTVRKSSSTSSLQDQDNNGSSFIWPTSRWNLKPDLQAFTNAAIGKPIFDGLPKPITSRKNKAALD
ncbi:putative LysM domain-containing protein [Lupinus albus]|uniref:Putative LysM domain-containing protein n=1 Tax=Lupinus albus TaxID=3870 RepID=A0A6A4NT05_LUPAL|nr:putative LysM domain-containing protein [Lupinus albus]